MHLKVKNRSIAFSNLDRNGINRLKVKIVVGVKKGT